MRRASLAHWFRSPEARLGYFRGRANAPAKLEGLRLHPASFRKFRGGAAELFLFSPAERGFFGANLTSLALAQARKTEAGSGRKVCRSEGILNTVILSSLDRILKLKSRRWIEFIVLIINGLRVVGYGGWRLMAQAAKAPKNACSREAFRVIFGRSCAI
jgi:hypothetical protein